MKKRTNKLCYGFHLTLYWQCLRVRFNLKHLGSLLHSVLGWLHSTLIRILRLCSLSFFFLPIFSQVLGTNFVYAQGSTPTFSPIYQTPTPAPAQSYHCPEEAPQYYLTKTPSASWLLNCEECLPKAVKPNYDWGPNPFETPGVEPTEIATPTPVVVTGGVNRIYANMLNPQPNPYEKDTWYLQNNINWWGTFGNSSQHISAYADAGPTQKIDYYNIQIDALKTGGYSGKDFKFFLRLANYTTGWTKYEFLEGSILGRQGSTYIDLSGTDYTLTGTTAKHDIYFANCIGTVTCTLYGELNLKVTTYYNSSHQDIRFYEFNLMREGIYHSYATVTLFYALNWNPIEATPEVTPTPGSSYCDTILDGNEEEEKNPFEFPGITIGEAACIGYPGITWSPTWLEWIFGTGFEINVPGIEFCFAPVDFGSLTVFGSEIDIDLLALGMAGVLLFRLITRG